MHQLTTHFVLGFHGCDRDVGEAILQDKNAFKPSRNDYDWLGHGIYFWENDAARGLRFAQEKQARNPKKIKNPYVIGAIIDLKFCLDFTTINAINEAKETHDYLKGMFSFFQKDLPANKGLFRNLDCSVIELIHKRRKDAIKEEFDSVKAIFHEGGQIYENSGFFHKTHTQICIRNQLCIIGTFRIEQPPLGNTA